MSDHEHILLDWLVFDALVHDLRFLETEVTTDAADLLIKLRDTAATFQTLHRTVERELDDTRAELAHTRTRLATIEAELRRVEMEIARGF